MIPRKYWLFVCLPILSCIHSVFGETYTPGVPEGLDFESFSGPFLRSHCVDCHSGDSPEGNLSLDDLGPVDDLNIEVWKNVWAQVTLREMPPKEVDSPDVVDRLKFSDWVVSELEAALEDEGGFTSPKDPNKGNFVDHELLFGDLPDSISLNPTSSPARIWRVTPQEHITRLNELINREPAYDPLKPGQRTRGDVVPTNHGGELKLYFGTDRIIKWQGGTVAYATAVKSVPVVLSTARDHGFENYPYLYSVNSAEATQILAVAEDIIKYMAYGPLSIANAYQITDDPASIADKMKGDLRGLPTSLVYGTEVKRPLTPVLDLLSEKSNPKGSVLKEEELIKEAVGYLFESLTFRPPTASETKTYQSIVLDSIDKLGKEQGVILGLSSIFLERDALFRPELCQQGDPDSHGRVMLQDWELALALNHALCYLKPDAELRASVLDGRMRTREDAEREVERMLDDPSIRKPRILRFFREYFDYDLGGYICKDDRALGDTGANARNHYRAMFDATASTDRLIELILEEDQDVLGRLLTTQQVVTSGADSSYFGRRRSEKEVAESEHAAKLAAAEAAAKQKAELEAWKAENPGKTPPKPKKPRAPNINHKVEEAKLSGERLYARVSRRSFGNGSMKPERKLSLAPEGQRLGLLTHPTWLVSHSDAMDNHAIRRGRWVRERLIGGGIPDVPITVDAMLPDEPKTTLRHRMRVTREEYCWTCHRKMDPLGLPFEIYNHAGLYRDTELNEAVDASGEIIDSGVPELDGKVENALEMINRLARSEHVEQVFVRHAFRFWMGRNETIHDREVLQDAHRAYHDSGGSMRALLKSLLTSDAFMYRRIVAK